MSIRDGALHLNFDSGTRTDLDHKSHMQEEVHGLSKNPASALAPLFGTAELTNPLDIVSSSFSMGLSGLIGGRSGKREQVPHNLVGYLKFVFAALFFFFYRTNRTVWILSVAIHPGKPMILATMRNPMHPAANSRSYVL